MRFWLFHKQHKLKVKKNHNSTKYSEKHISRSICSGMEIQYISHGCECLCFKNKENEDSLTAKFKNSKGQQSCNFFLLLKFSKKKPKKNMKS